VRLVCIQGSSLSALVENIVAAAIPQRYDTLLPIVRRLDEAKLDSYPHIAKLLDCVTSNMEQVKGTPGPSCYHAWDDKKFFYWIFTGHACC
jgi:hypothetical protein